MNRVGNREAQWENHQMSSRECSVSEYILEGHAASDVGNVRKNNEDNFILRKAINENAANQKSADVCAAYRLGRWNCIAVFDGMGGGEKGEEASQSAATAILATLEQLGEYASYGQIDEAIRQGFVNANNAIVKLQQESAVYGTTGTVCCMDGRKFRIYHLGDSRAYLFREGQLFQLTRDQTVAQMKIDAGFYSKDDPQVEAEKHQLTEYIGCDWTTENLRPIESAWIEIQSGDIIVLCSDGLYDMCTDMEMEHILRKASGTDGAADELVEKALANGGRDNVTCIVAKVTIKRHS